MDKIPFNLGNSIVAICAVLYLIAGIAYIVFEKRYAYGGAWICYSLANVCFVVGSIWKKIG
jgi:uncharacterized membrane protein